MRGTHNWTFDEIVQFLKQNGFVETHTRGSHHYYAGKVDGRDVLVEVQYHADVKGVIKQGTLQKGIVVQSRIPLKEWKSYAKMPANQRKKYRYAGCPVTI